jgi:SAM-dependent methyltransferase
MKNIEHWQPTKYTFHNQKLIGSHNVSHLNPSSRLQANLVAKLYQYYLPAHTTGKLGDLGCGNVPFYEAYKDLVKEVVCIDWPNTSHSQSFLDHACDLNEALPLPDASFDTLILSDVLEHIAEPQLLWFEMARILKPSGKLILNMPFYYRIHEAPHDYYRYTEFALRRFAEKTALNVLVLVPTGGALEIMTDFLAKNFIRLPLIGKPLTISIQWLCQAIAKTKMGSRFAVKSAVTMPFGYFMIVQKSDFSK